MPAKEWFSHYAKLFETVEINNSFYRLPEATTFSAWRAQAPPGFIFSVKMNQYGTHRRKLGDPATWSSNYVERAVLLGPCLGANLVQLPPRWHRDTGRLDDFLAAAADAAKRFHSARPLRWAVEFRDPSWLHDSVYDVLRRHGAALCCHDLLIDHPWALTTDWGYVRFHGPRAPQAKYTGEYGADLLTSPAKQLRAWLLDGRDVYVYFNNDIGGAAVRDARVMARLLT